MVSKVKEAEAPVPQLFNVSFPLNCIVKEDDWAGAEHEPPLIVPAFQFVPPCVVYWQDETPAHPLSVIVAEGVTEPLK